ncbi:MAG: NAD-dependent epimerase/dehydratase family protein [Patescibacteria group bacterium]|nr:NAD-dependent epimerase/dehydratase family protein [Patescibacteria group bacterium]MDE2015228.1 NAD-dependent epimerase/dehydratase family protein [Patescibacteria group bacterium]MDE2227034.1 NAD-dependent epimerase/dehydratase family protein [Patescibacteria group bacterium]
MDLKNKKILVTGGGGFLGQNLIKKLLERNVARENIYSPSAAELDLRVRRNCEEAVKGAGLVIHAAGITGNVQMHRDHPGQIFYDNLVMGVELMEAARKAGVEKFVTIGSATEYPENARLPLREEDLWVGPVEENHAPYTVAKKMLLVQAQAYRRQYGFNAIHLLLTSMYGSGEHKDGGPIPSIIQRVADARKSGSKYIEVWGTGKPTRDFLYAEDAVEGIVLAAEKYDKPEPINLGSGYEISIREVAETIMKSMGLKAELKFDTSKPDGQMRRILDTGRAEKEFGFKAVTDFEDGLRKTIAYHASLSAN